MQDNVVINKTDVIQRCVGRARKIFFENKQSFATDFNLQDAVAMNIQRACQAAIDLGNYLIKRDRLGIQQSAKDVFVKLNQAGYIDDRLSASLKKMVGFRDIVVHDYQELKLPNVIKIIEDDLDDFLSFSEVMLRDQNGHQPDVTPG